MVNESVVRNSDEIALPDDRGDHEQADEQRLPAAGEHARRRAASASGAWVAGRSAWRLSPHGARSFAGGRRSTPEAEQPVERDREQQQRADRGLLPEGRRPAGRSATT